MLLYILRKATIALSVVALQYRECAWISQQNDLFLNRSPWYQGLLLVHSRGIKLAYIIQKINASRKSISPVFLGSAVEARRNWKTARTKAKLLFVDRGDIVEYVEDGCTIKLKWVDV